MAAIVSGPLPKHYQLTEIFRQRILNEQYEPDAQFPTEGALCREFGVSRGTVRKALEKLVQERLLRREQGRGTFVNAPTGTPTFFTLTSFAEDMRSQHRRPGTRVLQADVILASVKIAHKLDIEPGAPVIHLVRLRLADEQPVAHETRYLAQALCPDLLQNDLAGQSVHTLLVEKYNLPLVRTSHTLEARVLSSEQAALLSAAPGSPAFLVDRLTFTVDGAGTQRPAVWYQALYRGDEYHFKTEFNRHL